MRNIGGYHGFPLNTTCPSPAPYTLLDMLLANVLVGGCMVTSGWRRGIIRPPLHTPHNQKSGILCWPPFHWPTEGPDTPQLPPYLYKLSGVAYHTAPLGQLWTKLAPFLGAPCLTQALSYATVDRKSVV